MDRNNSPVVARAEADRAEAAVVKRAKFDEQIAELERLGCETWQELSAVQRSRLVRAYFEENGEWGDALFDDMKPVFDALEHHDLADFGLAISMKLNAYVRPYVDKQLAYKAMCRREREEMLHERRG